MRSVRIEEQGNGVGQYSCDISFSGAKDTSAALALSWWLFLMSGLVALMVVVGGATRLTDSGLSITEWDVISGMLPPLSQEAWLTEFEKYQQIPEYKQVNVGFGLEAFKSIYWWEWGHRNLGRLIGLVFLVPLVFFLTTGRVVGRRLQIVLIGIFGLICLQGAIGWYMVVSGLTQRVDVSQYRLAMHLGMAVIIFGILLWEALRLRFVAVNIIVPAASMSVRVWTWLLLVVSFLQVILGAFVAGMRAGFSYNSWPLMDGRVIPTGYFADGRGVFSMVETVAAVQFNHRLMAYLLLVLGGVFCLHMWRESLAWRRHSILFLATVTGQAVLGIWTVLAGVPIWLGLLHQVGALAVITCALYNTFHASYSFGHDKK